METLIEMMQDINVGELMAIGIMMWFLYARLDNKITKVDEKLSSRIDSLSFKIDDVDRRLCRIEGSLATQGHCLIHQVHSDKKAE